MSEHEILNNREDLSQVQKDALLEHAHRLAEICLMSVETALQYVLAACTPG